MGFSDISFILIFILIFIPVYYLLPSSAKKYALLFGSIIFYGVNDIWMLPVLLIDVLIVYLLGIVIDKLHDAYHVQKFFMGFGVWLQILIMVATVVFSKADWLTRIITLFGGDASSFMESLNSSPLAYHSFIGIGFMTVTLIGYYDDIYSGKIYAVTNPINFFNYAFFFPKVLQGPITSYSDMEESLCKPRGLNADRLEKGLRMFVLGMSMKVLVADKLACLWNGIQTIGFDSLSTPLAWLSMYSYSIQLFLDFQGYSLMAIGIAGMLGFKLPDNFDSPYLSRSISEFYRRWHMTLGNWFKEHVYFRLGGSRNGKAKMLLSLSAVWVLTGLWHGLTLNFLFWGLSLLFFIILEKTVFAKAFKSDKLFAKIMGHIYVLIAIPFTWMLFSINDIGNIGIFFRRLFGVVTSEAACVNEEDFITYLSDYFPYLIAGLLCCFPIFENLLIKTRAFISKIVLFVLFWVSIYAVMKNGNNAFMYVNF